MLRHPTATLAAALVFSTGSWQEQPSAVTRPRPMRESDVLATPDLNRTLKDQGWVVDPIEPAQFRELIRSDIVRLEQAGARNRR